MPLVVLKAADKPSYVDVPVPEEALRREFKIAGEHETRFSRAFLKVSRSIYDPETKKRLLAGMEAQKKGEATTEDVVDQVEWFDPNDPLAVKRWELLGGSLGSAYDTIVQDAGEGEVKHQRWPFEFAVGLIVAGASLPSEGVTAVPTGTSAIPKSPAPPNPFSAAYVKTKTASLVREISDQQRNLLRGILVDSFERGVRSETILKEIETTVGLLERERSAVDKRRALLIKKGASTAVADKAAARYAKQLLGKRARRIARTETVDAYSQGLSDSWALAKDEGLIEPDVLQEWVELTDSPRTC